MNTITIGSHDFVISGKPHAKGRPRFRRSGRNGIVSYKSESDIEWESKVRGAYWGDWEEGDPVPITMHSGPVSIEIEAYFPIPRSWTRKKFEDSQLYGAMMSKPDIDNIIKGVTDALNKFAWVDDSQVFMVRAMKFFEDDRESEGHVNVSIMFYELKKHQKNKNKKKK